MICYPLEVRALCRAYLSRHVQINSVSPLSNIILFLPQIKTIRPLDFFRSLHPFIQNTVSLYVQEV